VEVTLEHQLQQDQAQGRSVAIHLAMQAVDHLTVPQLVLLGRKRMQQAIRIILVQILAQMREADLSVVDNRREQVVKQITWVPVLRLMQGLILLDIDHTARDQLILISLFLIKILLMHNIFNQLKQP